MCGKTVFICQASADIVHIIKEIDNLRKNTNTSIIIVCVDKHFYDCFNFLSIENVELIYQRRYYPPIGRPWKYLSWRRSVRLFLNQIGLNSTKDTLYFSSIYDDTATPCYVTVALRRGCKVKYLNHYDDIQSIGKITHVPFVQRLKLYAYRFLCGIQFEYRNMSGRWNVTRFPIEKYNIEELHPMLDVEICNKYAYRPNIDCEKAVLVFSQTNRDKNLIEDKEYDYIHHKLVEELKKLGCYVILKGHPIIGICNTNKGQADLTIPQMLPSELIDMTKIRCCFAFMTIALSSSAKIGVECYSMLTLMKCHNAFFDKAKAFIDSTSEGKIKYIESYNQLKSIIK